MAKYQLLVIVLTVALALVAATSHAAPVTWDGSGDMNWTQPDATSWGASTYNSNDIASFLGAGLGTVSIAGGGVTPGGTIVNAAGNYTFSGGGIGGTGGITKSGAGQLTLSNTDSSYSGQLSIEDGTVYSTTLNNDSANGILGNSVLPVILGASGQTGSLAIVRDGGVSSDKDFTLAAGGTGRILFGNFSGFRITNADRNLTLSGNIGGSGNFAKLGFAAVRLSGNNTYSGTTTVYEGPLRLMSANAIPGGIGAAGGTSALTINGITGGAVLELGSGDFLRGLGTGTHQFQIPGGISGFSANGGTRQVIVNNNPAFELV